MLSLIDLSFPACRRSDGGHALLCDVQHPLGQLGDCCELLDALVVLLRRTFDRLDGNERFFQRSMEAAHNLLAVKLLKQRFSVAHELRHFDAFRRLGRSRW